MFTDEICKPKTKGCSANSGALKTVAPLVRVRIEELSCSEQLVAWSTVHHPCPAEWGNALIKREKVKKKNKRAEIFGTASFREEMVIYPCCMTLLEEKNNKHLGWQTTAPLQGATAAPVCLKILCSFEVQNQTGRNNLSRLWKHLASQQKKDLTLLGTPIKPYSYFAFHH